jgi:hypothetical protein
MGMWAVVRPLRRRLHLGVGGCRGIKEISLVQLVEELVESHHLSMEEIKASDLEKLLRSLENSFQLVRTTVSTLKSSEESAITT